MKLIEMEQGGMTIKWLADAPTEIKIGSLVLKGPLEVILPIAAKELAK